MPPLAMDLVVAGLAAAGGALAWRAGGPPGRPYDPATPLRILVLAMSVLLVIGSLALAWTGRSGGPLLVGGAMLALGAGTWLGTRWWGRQPAIPERTADGPIRWPAVLALAVVGAAALVTIVAGAGLPLLATNPQASRAAFSGLTFDVFRWLVPPAALVVLAWSLARPSGGRLLAAAAALTGVVGLEVLLASRALPFELALGAVLIAWWGGRRLRLRSAAILGLAGVVLFFGVLLARMGPEASFRDPLDFLNFTVDRTVGRVVLIQARTVDVAVEAIPAQEPYWAGATYVRRLGALFGRPETHPPLGEWLYARLFPGAAPAFAAPGILAEAWVNAGLPLALGLMALLGLAAQGFGRVLGRLGAGPADRVAAVLVTIAIARTTATSLNGLLLTVAVTAAWWWLVRPGSTEVLRTIFRRQGAAEDEAPGVADAAGAADAGGPRGEPGSGANQSATRARTLSRLSS
jgi:hypothetical protein